jgi:hypothetical protein
MKNPRIEAAWTRCQQLYAAGDKLCAEGRLIYINAIIETYGKAAAIDWETGEIETK